MNSQIRMTNDEIRRNTEIRNDESGDHEPTHPRPLPRGERAFVRVLPVPLPGGVRGGFMVSMHAKETKEDSP